jgi:hypothetical protein
MLTLVSFIVDNNFGFLCFTEVFIGAEYIKFNIHKTLGSPVFVQIEAKAGRLGRDEKRLWTSDMKSVLSVESGLPH